AVFTLAQNFGNFSNQIAHSVPVTVKLLPHLTIDKTVTGDGTSAVIHPGDTASFTITVTDDGAGTATGIVVTDKLLLNPALTWSITWREGFASASLPPEATDVLLTASKASLAGGSTLTLVVSAPIPADLFGPPPGPPGNGAPLPAGLFELDGNATTT